MRKLHLSTLILIALFSSTMAWAAMKAPWSASYYDGSANGYRFSQETEADAVQFEYNPVQPKQSSSGTYSGGQAKKGRLDAKQVEGLQTWLAKLESETSLRASARAMGTGAFALKSSAGTREFILQDSPALHEFDAFLKMLR